MSGKPDWKNAPEWAQYLAMDADGAWWWFENPPHPYLDDKVWGTKKGACDEASESPFITTWHKSVEQRP